MTQKPVPESGGAGAFRHRLRKVRFTVDARIAHGTMTVGDLLALKPGSVVRSSGAPGGMIALCSGRVRLATAEAVVEEGRLSLRVEDVGMPGD